MTTAPDTRKTRQRETISSYLDRTEGFHTAQRIFDDLHAAGEQVSLPTVYRTLASMVESGDVDVLLVDGQSKYRRCSATHHHHIVCRACGRTVELDDKPFEDWATRVAKSYGFTGVTHITEFTGLCPQCAKA